MTKDLKDTIDNRMLYEAYPMAWIDNNYTTNKAEFIAVLYDVVKQLHQLNLTTSDIPEEIIKDKDLTDIKFYLTDKLFELTH